MLSTRIFAAVCFWLVLSYVTARNLPNTTIEAELSVTKSPEQSKVLNSRGMVSTLEPQWHEPKLQSIYWWFHNRYINTAKIKGPGKKPLLNGDGIGTASGVVRALRERLPEAVMLESFCRGCTALLVMSEQGVVSILIHTH